MTTGGEMHQNYLMRKQKLFLHDIEKRDIFSL